VHQLTLSLRMDFDPGSEADGESDAGDPLDRAKKNTPHTRASRALSGGESIDASPLTE
jgi:hypothetical protein